MSAVQEAALGFCRVMLRGDLKEVMTIEQQAYQFPWSKAIFLDCIKAGYHCRVLQLEHGIGAYSIMTVAANEAHLLNLCVDPQWGQRGLGRRLLEFMMGVARTHQAHTMFLEVRPSNIAALKLYRATQFCELGTRPNYYPAETHGGREDALLMARTL